MKSPVFEYILRETNSNHHLTFLIFKQFICMCRNKYMLLNPIVENWKIT